MKNTSGMVPLEYRVLLRLEKKEKVTAGGVHLPDDALERQQMAQVKATIVAVGDLAFTNEGLGFKKWKDAPNLGDRVVIGKYAGLEYDGEDGEPYRIVHDKDIAAVLA